MMRQFFAKSILSCALFMLRSQEVNIKPENEGGSEGPWAINGACLSKQVKRIRVIEARKRSRR